MQNKLEALRYFTTAADTLNFREAAEQLAISPSVISRVVQELEQELGEPLFKRHTRQIQLTSFGELFLAQAKGLLNESERLFSLGKRQNELCGIVRITVPNWHLNDQILAKLFTKLTDYPDIRLDWRSDMIKHDVVQDRIDIGLRIGLEMQPNFIARPIAQIRDMLVASPELIAQYGMPQSLADLADRFPFAQPLNPETGKPYQLFLNSEQILQPKQIAFWAVDNDNLLTAILHGNSVGLISDFQATPLIQQGKLVQLLPEIEIMPWQLYLYRPYQPVTPARVLKVFDLLTEILQALFSDLEK